MYRGWGVNISPLEVFIPPAEIDASIRNPRAPIPKDPPIGIRRIRIDESTDGGGIGHFAFEEEMLEREEYWWSILILI